VIGALILKRIYQYRFEPVQVGWMILLIDVRIGEVGNSYHAVQNILKASVSHYHLVKTAPQMANGRPEGDHFCC
jgi:hypothetical protein